jgi:hypothetical protein
MEYLQKDICGKKNYYFSFIYKFIYFSKAPLFEEIIYRSLFNNILNQNFSNNSSFIYLSPLMFSISNNFYFKL